MLKKIIVLGLLGVINLVNGVVPGNHNITNTAYINYDIQSGSGSSPSTSNVSTPSGVTITTVNNKPQIQLGYVTLSNSNNNDGVLQQGACYKNNSLVNLGNPHFINQTDLATPNNINFQQINIVKSGNPLFIKIIDSSQIKDATQLNTLDATITDGAGDKEVVRLIENKAGSGIFLGYIQTNRNKVVQSDCLLSVNPNDTITVSYTSVNNESATISASVLVDPLGNVFDSTDGTLVNGVKVSLVDATTGNLVTVYGDDGRSIYPSSMLTGQTVTDSGGNVYNYSQGQFRFPLVNQGNYKFLVETPTGYSFPSTIANSILQSNFPQYIIGEPSKGGSFSVINDIIKYDIPVDKKLGNLSISKIASNSIAAIGDFVQYTVTIQNNNTNVIPNVKFTDILPKGFQLKTNSFTMNNNVVIPNYDGKVINYNIGNIGSGQSVLIKYVTQISTGSSLGNNVNNASVSYSQGTFNANASIYVNDDLMTNKLIVVGNVYETLDCKKENLKPLKDIKIQFETGDYVISDRNGQFHIDNLVPVTHVGKIDKLSIPNGYEPILCENNNDFAGNPSSKFIRGIPGSIVRVDFYLKGKTLEQKREGVKELNLSDLLGNSEASLEVKDAKTGEKLFKEENKAGTEVLSLNNEFMRHATVENKLLFPTEGFNPPVPAIGVAYQTMGENRVVVKMNGQPVSEFNFDGIRFTTDRKTSIHYWRGIPLKDGKNSLNIIVFDENNREVSNITKELIFTTTVVEARFLPEKSKLIANGKDPIEIAVRFIDDFGQPAHKGLSGNYEIIGQFTPYIDRSDGIPIDMLNSLISNQTQYVIKDDGIAIIKLMPTSQGGELSLKFALKDNFGIIRPWITTAPRDWILVGIAEDSVLGKKILNHTTNDNKGMEVIESNNGRLAFYGKGVIKNDYLLTIAYDNKKQIDNIASNNLNNYSTSNSTIQQELYSVYGDSTFAQKDAASNKKIYLRIEKDKFFAMFGNYQTDLTVTDLTKYQRVLTGLKSEYKGDNLNYKLFAANTSTLLQKEEIRSDGTSGPFKTQNAIVQNSEIVTIVIRDRNQRDSVTYTKILNRYVDYNIDYDLSTITLKESLATYDAYFNPYFLRVEYNTLDPNGSHIVEGGRVGYYINKKTEIGVTTVRENGNNLKNDMTGVDLQYNSSELKLKLETALSNQSQIGTNIKGNGYNIEAQYQKDWGNIKAYMKKVDPNFGMVNNLPMDLGIQKQGIDTTVQISDTVKLKSQALIAKDLNTNAEQKLVDVKVEKKFNEFMMGYIGGKVQDINNPNNTSLSSINNTNIANSPTSVVNTVGNQNNEAMILGGEYRLKDTPIKLLGQIQTPKEKSLTMPEVVNLGAEYAIKENVTLVADQQYSNYGSGITTDITRFGVKSKPWQGGQVQGYVGGDSGNNPNNFYQLGINQGFKKDFWSFNIGASRQIWNKNVSTSVVPAGTLITQDNFTSYTTDAIYRNDPLVYQFKFEDKIGSLENKLRISNNIYKKLDGKMSVSVGEDYLKATTNGSQNLTSNIRSGFSYRGQDNTFLSQVSYINNNMNNQPSKKLIYNSHYNFKPNYEYEFFNHLGYKYVLSTFDNNEYTGSSYVFSSGLRKYLNEKWDFSLQGVYASTPGVGVSNKGIGIGLGYKLIDNAWISVGYEKLNSYNSNYSFDESYIKGWYVRLRFKFDEETFHLNNPQKADVK